MSVFHNNALIGSGGGAAAADTEFSVQKSVRFNDDDSAHFSKTPSSAGNRRTFTWSGWFKRSTIDGTHTLFAAGSDANNRFALRFSSGQLFIVDQIGGGAIIRNRTEQQFRDVSSWYHFVVAIDSTQSTSTDRLKLYVNGGLVEDYDITNYPSLNQQFNVNSTVEHLIGKRVAETQYFDGYMANVHFIDGLGLAASDFGFYDDNNVWRPKEYTGTFGTNGFHLFDFANESTIGHDSSGNNNDYTANNFSTSAGAGNDVLFDSPTNGDQSDTGAGGEVSGNYATLNPLQAITNSPTNGNLDIGGSSTSTYTKAVSTIYIDPEDTTGYYCEFTVADKGTNPAGHIQLLPPSVNLSSSGAGMTGGVGLVMRGGGGGNKWWSITDQSANTDTGVAHADSQVIGVAVKNGKLYMAINNTWVLSGNPATESNPLYSSLSGLKGFLVGTTDGDWQCNWGQRAFAYSAPSGYRPVSSAFLPTPTIADGSAHFGIKLYTGNGSTQSIDSLAFQPDFVWIKPRSPNAQNHFLYDSVRGAGRSLRSSTTAEEKGPNTGTDGDLRSFDANGFSLGSGAGGTGSGAVNNNNEAIVSWCWNAGSSTVSNTDGDITSNVRANQTAGFSIVTYTGPSSAGFQSVGHGLNAKPYFIISKDRDNARNWGIYHEDAQISDIRVLGFITSGTFNSDTATWDISEIDNSTFTPYFRDDFGSSFNADNVAYCFTPVAGFSAFGTYEGTYSFDGAFIYMGFRPAFFMWKNIDSDGFNWGIIDSTRGPYNYLSRTLNPNANNVESNRTTADAFDFLSNGVKVRATGSNARNQSGSTFIYAAFAENPFQANGGLAR